MWAMASRGATAACLDDSKEPRTRGMPTVDNVMCSTSICRAHLLSVRSNGTPLQAAFVRSALCPSIPESSAASALTRPYADVQEDGTTERGELRERVGRRSTPGEYQCLRSSPQASCSRWNYRW